MIKSFTRSACHNAVITPSPSQVGRRWGVIGDSNRVITKLPSTGAISIINQYYTNVRKYSNNSPYKANAIPNEHAAGNQKINFIYDYSKRLSLSLQYTHLEQLFEIVVLTMYVATYLGKKGGVVT